MNEGALWADRKTRRTRKNQKERGTNEKSIQLATTTTYNHRTNLFPLSQNINECLTKHHVSFERTQRHFFFFSYFFIFIKPRPTLHLLSAVKEKGLLKNWSSKTRREELKNDGLRTPQLIAFFYFSCFSEFFFESGTGPVILVFLFSDYSPVSTDRIERESKDNSVLKRIIITFQ